MRDFTLPIYKKLLSGLLHAGYKFVTFAEYVQDSDKKERTIILRHDVDRKPAQSQRTAEMENVLGIKGTYYFRVIKDELPKEVIGSIARLGHEIGYHYNVLNTVGGNMERALDLFQENLAKLRELAPVKTACMHGSPLSRHDNRQIWTKFDYHDLGIIGEPYFDIDFSEVLYLTDTGRRWDGGKVSIRDKVMGDGLGVRGKREEKTGERSEVGGQRSEVGGQRSEVRGERSEVRGERSVVMGKRGDTGQTTEDRGQKAEHREDKKNVSRGAVCDPPVLCLHSTMDIIKALRNNQLPEKIMLTVHPQRWTDEWLPWIGELVGQRVKNVMKYFIVRANR